MVNFKRKLNSSLKCEILRFCRFYGFAGYWFSLMEVRYPWVFMINYGTGHLKRN